jgi:hypothetical protein
MAIPVARTSFVFGKTVVNGKVNETMAPIKKDLALFASKTDALTNGVEKQFDQITKKPVIDRETKKQVETELTDKRRKELESEIKKMTPDMDKLREKFDALKDAKIRINDSVFVGISALLNTMLDELVLHGLKTCKLGDKNSLLPEHIKSDGCEKLSTYPLFHCLPCWLETPDFSAKSKTDKSETSQTTQNPPLHHYIEKFIKSFTSPPELDENGNPVKESVERMTKNKESESGEKVAKTIQVTKKKKTDYSGIKSKKETRFFLEKILIEFMYRLYPMMDSHLNTLKVKTMSESHLLHILDLFMLDGSLPVEELVESYEEVHDPKLVKEHKTKVSNGRESERILKSGQEKDKDNKNMVALTAERKKFHEQRVKESQELKKIEDIPKVKVYRIVKRLVHHNENATKLRELVESEVKKEKDRKEKEKKDKEDKKKEGKEEK